jgi:hypothetical protein
LQLCVAEHLRAMKNKALKERSADSESRPCVQHNRLSLRNSRGEGNRLFRRNLIVVLLAIDLAAGAILLPIDLPLL